MSLRRIRIFGDPVLTTPAEPVTDFDELWRILVDDMMETMDHYRGAGLAANQVGVLRRVFVYNCGGRRGHIVNPVWEHEGDETQYGPEGCLSVPSIHADTRRWMNVSVTGQTVDGDPVSFSADGILARCIQHETDHLDGVMYMRRLEPDIRKETMAQIRTAEWFAHPELAYRDKDGVKN